MPLPTKVLVGYRYVTIVVRDDMPDDTDGELDIKGHTISINGKQHPEEIPNTLIHELLHAIWGAQGLPREEKDNEEEIVMGLANGLTQALLANPFLLSYLNDALVKQREVTDGR